MHKRHKTFKRLAFAAVLLTGAIVVSWATFEYYLSLPCPKERPLRDSQSRFCYACDSDEEIQLDAGSDMSFKTQCALCPNRELDRYLGFYCVLKCPADKPLQDFTGACHACEKPSGVHVGYTYESACAVCENRDYAYGFCFKKCPKEKPYRDDKGTCFAKIN